MQESFNSNYKLRTVNSINIQGTIIDFDQPKVMGILNVTPDSFFSGSRVQEIDLLQERASQMLHEGATFLDIGGYSSRPGATDIPVEEELNRVLEPIRLIANTFPDAVISIDTFRAEVARQAVGAGAHMVNDISGGQLDDQMYATVGELKVPYIGMHMKGTPQTMKQLAQYDDLLKEVMSFFSRMQEKLHDYGVQDIIFDPGFGFAKNIDQNFQLLRSLSYFQNLEKPLLVGLSRKSMIHKTLKISAEESLNGTTVLNTIALMSGASILRVHDVREAKEAIHLTEKVKK